MVISLSILTKSKYFPHFAYSTVNLVRLSKAYGRVGGVFVFMFVATFWGICLAYPEPFKGKTERGYSGVKDSLSS